MPPLSKEVLRQISSGEIESPLKFVGFRLELTTPLTTKPDLPVGINGHIVYIVPASAEHIDIRDELDADSHSLPSHDNLDYLDAGRIRKETNGKVVFYGRSTGIEELGKDPIKREEIVEFVKKEIVDPEIEIGW